MKITVKSAAFSGDVGVLRAAVDEGINRVSTIDLTLVTRDALSDSGLNQAVGQPMTIRVEDIIDGSLKTTRFDGVIFELIDVTGEEGTAEAIWYYAVRMRPKLWDLNYHIHARAYPDTTRPKVIDDLLASHGLSEGSGYKKKYYKEGEFSKFYQIQQMGESDLGFFSRVLSRAGINYFFANDDDGATEEILRLTDHPGYFLSRQGEIPIIAPSNQEERNRRVAYLSRTVRAVPSKVAATAFLTEGSLSSQVKSEPIEKSGTDKVVAQYVPEGGQNAELAAKRASRILSEGYAAKREVYQGESDHIGIRPGWRVTLKDCDVPGDPFQILVVETHHLFEQKVLAALSEDASAPSYINHFRGASSMAPVHPLSLWNDVDIEMSLSAGIDPHPGVAGRHPVYTFRSHKRFNPKHRPIENRDAIINLADTLDILEGELADLSESVGALARERSVEETGLTPAEVTKDAWVTEGKELVCMVKAEQFQDPIRVKTTALWHSPGGGSHYLPREGMYVWIAPMNRGRRNDWAVVGYRPGGSLAMYDPAGTFKLKVLGDVVQQKTPDAVVAQLVAESASGFGPVMELNEAGPAAGEDEEKPHVVHARLIGAYFDTDKTFLLPTAIPHIAEIKTLYDKYGDYDMVVVGHTDDAGDAAYNETLSLERAEATTAYLKDDVEAWYAWYGDDKSSSKRWGDGEDRLMIKSLPDYPTMTPGDDMVRWFQRTRGLKEDGIAGPDTRKALITEYMSHDNTTLPAGMNVTVHGCGAYFPRPDAPPPEAQGAADRHTDIEHRRIEFFLFKPPFGIDPAPPGDISPEGSEVYTKWYRMADERHDLRLELRSKKVDILEMHDALFRTNSAVLMPEGEDPSSSDHQSISTVGMVSSALRFNEEHPGKTILVAGHCDTSGTVDFNQPLSEERAQTTLALLKGDREAFKSLCDARHDDVDLNQIFDWASRDPNLGLNCAPSNPGSAANWESINRFQAAYNQWLDEGASAGETRGPERLDEDGDAGPLTWGGIFDCYEYSLKKELGEEDAGVAALREKLVWVDSAQPWRGYSEHHPVDNLGRDNYRSQANRRVEILFFDPDEQPNLNAGGGAPEMSDIYLPGNYERAHLGPMVSAKPWRAYWENESEPAKMDQVRKMILEAPELPAGLEAIYTVYQIRPGIQQSKTETMKIQSELDRVLSEFDGWFNPDLIEYKEDEPFPLVDFSFQVETGGRVKTSSSLPYRDWLHATLVHEDTGLPFENNECRIHSPWGVMKSETASDGVVELKNLPPGGIRVIARRYRLVEET